MPKKLKFIRRISLRNRAILSIFAVMLISLSFYIYITVNSHRIFIEDLVITKYAAICENAAHRLEIYLRDEEDDKIECILQELLKTKDIIAVEIRSSNPKLKTKSGDYYLQGKEVDEQIRFITLIGETAVHKIGNTNSFFGLRGSNYLIVSQFQGPGNVYASIEFILSSDNLRIPIIG